MTSPTRVEGQPQPPINANPPSRVGVLSDREVRSLADACSRATNEQDKNFYRLIEVTSLVVAIAVANLVTLAAGGLFFGIAAGLLVDTTFKSLYSIFKNRDLEYAAEALSSDGFKRHLSEKNLNPTVLTLASMWNAYNRDNLKRNYR